jgi:hypothetical protein
MWRRELQRNLLSRGQVRRCRHRRWFPAVTEMWLNHVIERCCVLEAIMHGHQSLAGLSWAQN